MSKLDIVVVLLRQEIRGTLNNLELGLDVFCRKCSKMILFSEELAEIISPKRKQAVYSM